MNLTVVLCPDCVFEALGPGALAASAVWAEHFLQAHARPSEGEQS